MFTFFLLFGDTCRCHATSFRNCNANPRKYFTVINRGNYFRMAAKSSPRALKNGLAGSKAEKKPAFKPGRAKGDETAATLRASKKNGFALF